MISGLYTSASGLLTLYSRQLVINNNLANIQTTGYKQDIAEQAPFEELYIQRVNDVNSGQTGALAVPRPVGLLGTGVGLDRQVLDLAQGQLEETQNPLDIALVGNGFFQVQTPDGVRYTRDGSFVRDNEGRLTTVRGDMVLDNAGAPITLPEGEVTVSKEGSISVGGNQVSQLGIIEFAEGAQLNKTGQNLLEAGAGANPQPSDTTVVQQGFLERSNVDPTKAMVDMMTVARAYEASQKILQFQDKALEKAVNDIAGML